MGRRNGTRKRLTAEQRAEFARERQKLVGSIISQKGFEGALVMEHIRGSQYLIRLASGEQIYMSHKKPRFQKTGAHSFITEGGWSLWESRNESR